jgi:hypothetical protein
LKTLLSYIRFVMHSKGVAGVIPRLGMLLARFDIGGKKMKTAVAGINELGAKYGFRPAMIVPAVVLKRCRALLQYASDSNLEFAIHGHTHKNHRPWSLEKQKEEIEKAKRVFDDLGVPYCGFRAPYLSCNSDTDDALEQAGILWNSDQAIMWPHDTGEPAAEGYALNEAIEFLYSPADASQTLALPRMHGDMVCIPLVLPDDEILVDRVGIQDPDRITKIWLDVLSQAHAQGAVFVLQYHPERFIFCQKSMEALLAYMARAGKRFWVTDMCEIARWWKARNAFGFSISQCPDDAFEVVCSCSDRAVILVHNGPGESVPFHGKYRRITETCFRLETEGIKPCIGISPLCTPALQVFIKELGFAYELADTDSGYGIFFNESDTYTEEGEIEILDRIEQSNRPLVRYWPWPDGYESAFTTSHDLDCVTLSDFVYRALGW